MQVSRKSRLKNPEPFKQRGEDENKHGLKDNAREPERAAARNEIEEGQGRPFILAVVLQLHVDHSPPQAEAMKEDKEKIKRGQRPDAKQACRWRRRGAERNHADDTVRRR